MQRRVGARLGDALLEAGWVTERDIAKALELQASFGGRLGTNLLEIGAVGEGELLATLGRLRHTQTVEADGFQSIPPDLLRLVPPKLAKRFEVVPVRRSGGSLLVASIDPGDALAEDELSTVTGSLVRTVIGLEIRVRAALERYYRISQSVRLTALTRRLDGRASGAFALAAETAANDVVSAETPRGATSATRAMPPWMVATPALARTATMVSGRVFDPASGPVSGAIVRPRPQPPPRVEPIREVVISEEEYANIFGPGSGQAVGAVTKARTKGPETEVAELPTDPEARLEATADRLACATTRDDVAAALLDFCRPELDRRLLLIRRGPHVIGWRGEGSGMDLAQTKAIEIEAGAPSLFGNLTDNPQLWVGPLPPFPAQDPLLDVLGATPNGCVVAPLIVRARVIGFLYADNGADGVDQAPIPQLERLIRMAGLALEVALLKSKIRTL